MVQAEAGGGKNDPPPPPAPPSPALHAGSKVSNLLWRSISRIYTCVANRCAFIHVNMIVNGVIILAFEAWISIILREKTNV